MLDNTQLHCKTPKKTLLQAKKFHYKKKLGYNINVLQETACLAINPITVGNFLSSLIARRCLLNVSNLKTYELIRWYGTDALAVCQAHRGLPVGFLCSDIQFYLLFSPYVYFISFFIS